ncbi:MAG: hypothetical protein GWO24_12180, partial [Akkermansiaceae bacterium]|nr:hypothetical protein [Akkermansiaceae bacterium]
TERLNAAIAAATQLYTSARIDFPAEKWRLGFERYTETPPRADATAYLSYQLDAMSWLFDSLASAKPTALINVYRKELPVEEGNSMDAGEDTGASRGRSSRSNRSRSRQGAA